MANIEMAIDDMRVSPVNYQRVIILKEKEGERYLPIWIGPAEWDAIAITMQNVAVSRPLTHDVLCWVINELGASVSMIIIDKLQKDSFEAKLVLASADKSFQVDCRPSDAIAVAVRARAPIFVEKSVLDKTGILFDKETGKPCQGEDTLSELAEEHNPKLAMFSAEAKQVLSSCEEEAKRSGHDYIETRHLLIALSQETNSIAATVLTGLGVEAGKLQSTVGFLVTESKDGGLSANVKTAIALAVKEANRLNDRSVSSEHLLLGLIREGEGGAAKVLESLGINPEKIFIELLRLRKQGFHWVT